MEAAARTMWSTTTLHTVLFFTRRSTLLLKTVPSIGGSLVLCYACFCPIVLHSVSQQAYEKTKHEEPAKQANCQPEYVCGAKDGYFSQARGMEVDMNIPANESGLVLFNVIRMFAAKEKGNRGEMAVMAQ
ncbi:hypothetical protein [Reticulibacter mediterranei]|uniref:hypothetical protein n=1 Tax=Reticulibacter mediterranei TaxID=2778369 RepID=UPI001C68D374|nr:hypothetical protein [Reticulibacter mediterranei]